MSEASDDLDRLEVIGACPLDCPDGCSWVVTVADGKATRLRGNPDHPFTRGGLCKKVNPWLDFAADDNRLLTPLRRIGPKGPGHGAAAFEAIGWDEALDEIADRFSAIIDRSGPAAIWPFVGTGNVGYLQGAGTPAGARLWNHLGVSDHEVTICSIAGRVGLSYTMGTPAGLDPEDLATAGTVLIWGANPLISNQHLWPFVEQAREAGAPVVVVDPVRTRTAARADVHLAPRVGTDGALALGLCRALLSIGAVDRGFVEARTVGFDEFAASVEPWTPAATAEVCGIEPAQIEALAALIAERAPLGIKLGQGMQRQAQGGQTARIVSCLPALTGAFAQPGGGLVYSTGGLYEYNVERAGGSTAGRPRSLAMTNLAANLRSGDDGADGDSAVGRLDPPVEALFIYGANPVVSNPDTIGVRSGLSRPDLFTVVVDVYHTETVDYADVVLPSTLQHEQWELNDSFSHLYVNLNRPAVAPPGQCLPHTEIFRRLARAMDIDDPDLQASDAELIDALLDTPAFVEAGITRASLLETGWARLPGTDSYRPFANRFPTPSGRFEFASDRAEADGHGRLPTYTAPVEAGQVERSGRYDLVAAAGDWHINSVFAGTDRTLARTGAPPVAVNPDDAARDGVVDGQLVTVANDRGRFTAVAAVDATVRAGTAVTTKGWWGMGINNTVAERDADMGRGAVYHDNCVVITPSEPSAI